MTIPQMPPMSPRATVIMPTTKANLPNAVCNVTEVPLVVILCEIATALEVPITDGADVVSEGPMSDERVMVATDCCTVAVSIDMIVMDTSEVLPITFVVNV